MWISLPRSDSRPCPEHRGPNEHGSRGLGTSGRLGRKETVMRVVITGATGNVGTSTIQALAADPKITSILGLARRTPDLRPAKTEWAEADVTQTDLAPLFSEADAVVHLAWLFQPTHDSMVTWRANVLGSARVFAAAAQAK